VNDLWFSDLLSTRIVQIIIMTQNSALSQHGDEIEVDIDSMDAEASSPSPSPLDMRRILDRSESITKPPNPTSLTCSARTLLPKKPKANDPDKRDMTYDEKQKLSTRLQNLPPDKVDAIVQIIKKQNSALSQHDDEIEVDIDILDVETLWELDRYFTDYKKSLSKIKYKRKAELDIQARGALG